MVENKKSRPPKIKGLRIRKLLTDDIENFVKFFKSEGVINQNSEEFKWQYNYHSTEVKDIYIAEPIEKTDREKYFFAAVYCISPRKFLIDKNEYGCSLSLQTLTGVPYRSRGLFVHLAKTCYNEAKKEGVKFVYGSPNDNSMPSFIKHLDWHKMPKISVLIKFNLLDLVKGKLGIKKKNSNNLGKIFEVNNYYEPLNNLWNEFSKNIKLGLVRDADYWNWRYLERPNSSDRVFVFENKKGKLLASCSIGISYKKEGRRGYIMDFMVDSMHQNEGIKLLNWCSSLLFREGCIFVVTCQSLGNPYKDVLRKSKFRVIPKYFHPQGPRLALTILDDDFKYLVTRTEDWHITYGDFDVL